MSSLRYIILVISATHFAWRAVSGEATIDGCAMGHLDDTYRHTPPVSLHDAVVLQLRPRNMVKVLRLVIVLENTWGQQVYRLAMDADIGVHWGDVSLALQDVNTYQNVLKLSWPPILLHGIWTILYLRLPFQHLFQLGVIPKEAQENPQRSMDNLVIPTPLATSTRLTRSGITRTRIELLTSNTTVDYKINCNKGEYMAASFAASFGIPSSASLWQTWVWVLLKKPTGVPSVITTVHRQENPEAAEAGGSEGGLRAPRVTVGVVSSRAPSPGVEVDENTFDYINRAFTHDSDHETPH
ncbi:hypothetical protein C7M84_013185 [Penaeus vannamei]|uniref:Uncharacterized protein n=1 Tax=Penaeus vannamei TaxID=6689 RepID=A0A3R7MSE9_PENVA|nr:hypothetical protein C7M84_013185 [Penaeus vannamei]